MKLLVLALVVAASGCVAPDDARDVIPPPLLDSESPNLAGNWFLNLNSGCVAGLNFGPDHAFAASTVCAGGTPPIAMEVSRGTYTATASRWTATISQSTCSDAEKAYGDDYVATAGNLTLTQPSQVILFARNTAQGGNGVITFGCFRMGMFTESPLAPL